MDFWHALPDRNVASNDEAFHALLLFADGADPAGEDYAARVELLKQRAMLPPNFDRPAEEGVRRGVLAVALAKALDVRGGATMRLFGPFIGPTPRYAMRELQYLGLYPPGSPQQTFSGSELMGVIGRAEDYTRANPEIAIAAAARAREEATASAAAAARRSDESATAQRHPSLPPGLVYLLAAQLEEPATQPQTGPSTRDAAAAAGTQPAELAAGDQELVVTVTAVRGVVQVRRVEGAKWEPVEVGMILDEGAEFRTGPRSAIQFVIEPDQTVTLDRLGTIKVLQAVQNLGADGKVTTDLGMKYGRARYNIRPTGVEYESAIRSPGSTLAVRGTDVVYEDQAPWIPTATSREGRAQFRNFRREFLAFGGTGRVKVAADKNAPAEAALDDTRADPRGAFAGRTAAEDKLIVDLGSANLDPQGLKAVQELARLTGFEGTFAGVPPIPGPLEFQLGWNSATDFFPTNLDLSVTDPDGNTATALNPMIGTGSAVGVHGGDDAGAPAPAPRASRGAAFSRPAPTP